MSTRARFSLTLALALCAGLAAGTPAPARAAQTETVVLAGGCFWGMELVFGSLEGVKEAMPGYSGGSAATAHYELVSTGTTGHAESVRVTYDPAKISYEQLLQVYFTVAHDPTELNRQGPDEGTQYRSAIFVANDDQRERAEAYIKRLTVEHRFNAPIVTKLETYRGFYPAEAYHRNYAVLHPDDPYIMYNDAPKLAALKKQYPQLVGAKVAAAPRGEASWMPFSARVLLDSRSAAGARLTTMEVRYPRFIHSEMMTHRVFSRNAASSRAIPIKKMIAAVREEPALPISWGRNQAGMSAREEIGPELEAAARAEWQAALDDALRHAERLSEKDIDLHKQLVNRLLEPFAWITVIITATEWANFFTQRAHPDAQPEIRHVAELMLAAYRASAPSTVADGHWHLPLVQDDERDQPEDVLCKLSVARCARVSYLTHDGRRDRDKDLELYERLLGGGANGHWSPFEHVATPVAGAGVRSANFSGWEQFRKRFPQENAATFPDAYATAV